jgi:DNA-directed RNA polymerase subunit F
MAEEVRIWQVDKSDALTEIRRSALDREARIEKWIISDVSLLSPDLLIIGEQVETAFGKLIDLLCIDRSGSLVIVELKRHMTPREVTAQVLDYASWVKDLDAEAIDAISARYLKSGTLEAAFQSKFGIELPEVINEHHAMLVVASEIDDSTERIIRYLSETYGVDINAVRFEFFQTPNGGQLLVRTFTVAPEEAETNAKKRPGKRSPPATREELEKAASDAGVGDLYRRFKQGLESYFSTGTTKTTLYFAAKWPDGSRKVVWALVPGASSSEDGLRYQLYSKRLSDLLHLDEDEVVARLPSNRERWDPWHSDSPEFKGWAGYIKNDDIQKIVDLVKKIEIGKTVDALLDHPERFKPPSPGA